MKIRCCAYRALKQRSVCPFVKETELSPERLEHLFGADFEGIRNRLIIELFYQTGMRLSELIDLKEGALTEQYLKVLGKRNKERVIPISVELSELIFRYKNAKKALGLVIPIFWLGRMAKHYTHNWFTD